MLGLSSLSPASVSANVYKTNGMKLEVNFSNSRDSDSLPPDERCRQPLFLAQNGVSGRVHIGPLRDGEVLTGTKLEIRLLGRYLSAEWQHDGSRKHIGFVKTSMTWQEASLATPDTKYRDLQLICRLGTKL